MIMKKHLNNNNNNSYNKIIISLQIINKHKKMK